MPAQKKLLAFDLGAESGRGVLGLFDGQKLRLEVVHRFPNGPVRTLDTLHWDVLRQPLGFTRPRPPHATTLSRLLAGLAVDRFEQAFAAWLGDALRAAPLDAVACDGKTSKQGLDQHGDPIHTLNVFVHDLKVCLAQWPVTDEKATEPEVLKAHLAELLERYPGLSLFTGDALFCQRPLAGLLVQAARHYLFAVKDNQPDLMEAMHTAFDGAAATAPDARSGEKRGRWWTGGGCGSIATRGTTRARG